MVQLKKKSRVVNWSIDVAPRYGNESPVCAG